MATIFAGLAGLAALASTGYWWRFESVTSARGSKPWSRWPQRKEAVPARDSEIVVQLWEEDGVQVEVWVKKADFRSKSSDLPPFVFVHGPFQSAYVFENYLRFYAAREIDCYAISLRDHGRSSHFPGREVLHTLDEFATDIGVVVGRLLREGQRPPVIFGHSFGGAIAQHFLSNPPANVSSFAPRLCSTFVHLNSLPPHHHQFFTRLYWNEPWKFLASLQTFNDFHMLRDPKVTKLLLFSPTADDATVTRFWASLDRVESMAAAMHVGWSNLRSFCDPARVLENSAGRVVVVGAYEDIIVTHKAIGATMAAYKAAERAAGGKTAAGYEVQIKRVIVPGAHNHFLEESWEEGADKIGDAVFECLYAGGNVLDE